MKVLSTVKKTKTTSFLLILHTIFVAIFCDIKSLNYALTYGGFIGEGAMAVLYSIIVACIFTVSILRSKFRFNSFRPYGIFLILYLVVFFLFTVFFIGPPHVSLSLFCVFVVCAFLIPNVTDVKARLMIKLIMCMPFFAVFRLNQIFGITEIWLNEISMDASYSFLLPIIANIVYIRFYFKDEKKFAKIVTIFFSAINCVFLGYVLIFGSRAPILCILSLLVFWYLSRMKQDGIGVRFNKNKVFELVLIVIVLIVMGQVVITGLVSFLESYGISISALNKIISLGDDGDVSNGRNELYTLAVNGFYESPLFGHGLDRFDARYPGTDYPHNFILQALYDGGLLLTLLLLLPLSLRIKRYFKKCSYDDYVVFSLLFFASVPGALFSQDLWSNAVLWLCFGLLFSKHFVYEKCA